MAGEEEATPAAGDLLCCVSCTPVDIDIASYSGQELPASAGLQTQAQGGRYQGY